MAQPAMLYRYYCEDSMAHAASGHGLMGISALYHPRSTEDTACQVRGMKLSW